MKIVKQWKNVTYSYEIMHPTYGLLCYSFQIDEWGEYMNFKIFFGEKDRPDDSEVLKLEREFKDFLDDYQLP